MSEPGLLLQAGPQAQKAGHSLWDRAPGLRNLTIAASILTMAAVAIPVLLPQPAGIGPPSSALSEHTAPVPVTNAGPTPVAAIDQPATASSVHVTAPQAIPQPVAPAQHQMATSSLGVASSSAQSEPVSAPASSLDIADTGANAPALDLPAGAVIVSPGVLARVNQHNRYSRGQDWPIVITIISPPAHGTISIQDSTALIKYRDGVTRMSPVKQVFYKSESGYTGVDRFTYKRISGDGADPLNANTYTMTIGVK